MHARHETKHLEDGSANPKWKPRAERKAVKNTWVAWDGEGYQTASGQHYYTLFGAYWDDGSSEGRYVTIEAKAGERLHTRDILKFIEEVKAQCPPEAIHVGFALVYDNTHIFYDLPWGAARNAVAGEGRFRARYGGFRIKITPRKMTEIYFPGWRRDLRGVERERKRLILYDVWGFFQGRLVDAVEQWLGKDYPDLPLIKAGKEARGLEDNPINQRAYMRAELRALVRMMAKLNESFLSLGFALRRWHGPGAAATAAYERYMPKGWFSAAREALIENPAFNEAVERAYFGGRVEMLQFGRAVGRFYDYDINSAYPHAMRLLPDITKGEWKHSFDGGLSDSPLAVYHVVWDFPHVLISPFPLRTRNGSVYFPCRGEGWYWTPEIEAALDVLTNNPHYRHCTLQILEKYEWVGPIETRPFSWVEEMYQKRHECVREGRIGEQLALKLTLNSLYGKTAQRVGYVPWYEEVTDYQLAEKRVVENERPQLPPFYNLIIAGYITSTCRSMVFRAATENPRAVIAIATDGLITTKPLRQLPVSEDKLLGGWSVKVLEGDLLSLQAGVIYFIDKQGRVREKTRGFAPLKRVEEVRARMEQICQAWETGQRSLFIPNRKLIGLRAATATASRWTERGKFVEEVREIKLWPPESGDKRTLNGNGVVFPARGLVQTYPNQPITDLFSNSSSYPYSVSCRAIDLEQVREYRRQELAQLDTAVALCRAA